MELHAQIACAMPMELYRKGIGPLDRAVYCEAVLFCRDNLTDGVIERTLLELWMPGMAPKEQARRLDALVARGALKRHKTGWAFPPHVWAAWNPSRAEVDEKREAEAKRKAEYRAKRQREANIVPDVSQRDINGTRPDARVTATHPSKQPEPEPEPEPEPITTSARSLREGDGFGNLLKLRTVDEAAS